MIYDLKRSIQILDDCLCQVLYSFQLILFIKQSPKYSKEQFIQTLPIWSFLKFRTLIQKKYPFFKIKKRGRRISQAYLESDDDIEGPIEEVINSVSVLVNINKMDSLQKISALKVARTEQTLSLRQGTTKADQMLGPRLS